MVGVLSGFWKGFFAAVWRRLALQGLVSRCLQHMRRRLLGTIERWRRQPHTNVTEHVAECVAGDMAGYAAELAAEPAAEPAVEHVSVHVFEDNWYSPNLVFHSFAAVGVGNSLGPGADSLCLLHMAA